jgi:nucleoside-diphosphate-sugar epimerase
VTIQLETEKSGAMRAVITGGAGFLGSHLSEKLLENGWEVLCVDNLVTGTEQNIAHLLANRHFRVQRQDASLYIDVAGPVDYVLHLASPASPVDYARLPIQTLKVGALGTHNWRRQRVRSSCSHPPPSATGTRWSRRNRRATGET